MDSLSQLLRVDLYGCSANFLNLVCRLFFDCVKKSKINFNISDDKIEDIDDEIFSLKKRYYELQLNKETDSDLNQTEKLQIKNSKLKIFKFGFLINIAYCKTYLNI